MRIPRPGIVDRRFDRFRADPASVRNATLVIVSVTTASVLAGSFVMWIFADRDFPDYWTALWFTLQTVTTVGYGDVTPDSGAGRFIAGIVMIFAIGFLAIVTALITSTFVDAAQRQRRRQDSADERESNARVHARLDELHERLAAIEATLGRLEGRSAPAQASDVGPIRPPDTGAPTDPSA